MSFNCVFWNDERRRCNILKGICKGLPSQCSFYQTVEERCRRIAKYGDGRDYEKTHLDAPLEYEPAKSTKPKTLEFYKWRDANYERYLKYQREYARRKRAQAKAKKEGEKNGR